jgi:hypothetical protein
MNTNNQQYQKKNQRQKSRQGQTPKKHTRSSNMLHDNKQHHEHELPEMRLTR